jgi:hypothetical protein
MWWSPPSTGTARTGPASAGRSAHRGEVGDALLPALVRPHGVGVGHVLAQDAARLRRVQD